MSSKQTKRYRQALSSMRHELSPLEKAISIAVHRADGLSTVLVSALMRPNAVLAGAIAAAFIPALLYLVATYVGYPLSGTEFIASFIIGWLAGSLYDFLKVMITGKK